MPRAAPAVQTRPSHAGHTAKRPGFMVHGTDPLAAAEAVGSKIRASICGPSCAADRGLFAGARGAQSAPGARPRATTCLTGRRPFPLVIPVRARALLALCLVASGSPGCGDLLGFGSYQAVCGPEIGAAPGGRRWAARFGDGAAQRALGVAVDAEGAVLVAGSFAGTLDTGGDPLESLGAQDAFVVKLAADGQPLWSRRFGGPGYQSATRIAAGAGGHTVVAGRFNGQIELCGVTRASDDEADTDGSALDDEGKDDLDKDVFVVELDAEGECVWSASFGSFGDQGVTGLALGQDGSIFLAGSFLGSLDLGKPCPHLESQTGTDVFVARLGSGGTCQWTRQLDFGGADVAEGLSVDASGRLWMAGACGGGTAAPCDMGAGRNLLLSKVEIGAEAGDVVSRAFGGSGDQVGLGVVATGTTVVVTGSFDGTLDFGVSLPLTGADSRAFLATLTLGVDGQVLEGAGWSKGFTGTSRQAGTALALDGTGTLALAGTYAGDLDLGTGQLPSVEVGEASAAPSNVFVGAFDAAGAVQWSRAFGDGKSVVTAAGVAVDGKGDVIVVGSLAGAASCGEDAAGGTLESAGDMDVFVARLRLR